MTTDKLFKELGYKKYYNKNDKELNKLWGKSTIVRYRKIVCSVVFEIVFN